MTGRADIFGVSDFDIEGFTPATPAPAAPPEAVRKVAERAQFSSREPERKRAKREPRRYRTGRNTNFVIKADPEVVAEFYAIADAQEWVLGETLERAVAALRKELERESRGAQS